MTEIKVQVGVVCSQCHSKLMLSKKRSVVSTTLKCPKCGQSLHVVFDVSKEPQTYKLQDEEQKPLDKGKTINRKFGPEDRTDRQMISSTSEKGKTVYGNGGHKTPHNVYNDWDDNDDDYIEPKPRKRARLRERIYLTHVTWFGLKNQRYQLFEGTTTVGRYDIETPSDISIKGDETISRRSVAIIIEEENGIFDYKLKVLNATNKVKVNDLQIREGQETYLEFGDIIMLGNSKFKFDNH